MKKNLILTITINYPYNKLKPLVETLNKTNFNGDLVLFYGELSQSTLDKLHKNNVKTIKFNYKKFKEQNFHVIHYRFSLFYNFLKKNIEKYNQVLLSDARDIVFQSNPFEYKKYGNLNFFFESQKIIDSEINSYCFEKVAGSKSLEKYGKNLISCAGTTIGKSKEILIYLKEMNRQLKNGTPIDQGLHNYLFYSKKFPNAKGFKNFYGPVLTISGIKNKDLKYNKKGQIVDHEGEVIPIIHQYDRIPQLVKKFNTPKDYIIKIIEANYIKFKRSIKKLLFSLPFFGNFFQKRYPDPYLKLQ